jgi:hypothetical protein
MCQPSPAWYGVSQVDQFVLDILLASDSLWTSLARTLTWYAFSQGIDFLFGMLPALGTYQTLYVLYSVPDLIRWQGTYTAEKSKLLNCITEWDSGSKSNGVIPRAVCDGGVSFLITTDSMTWDGQNMYPKVPELVSCHHKYIRNSLCLKNMWHDPKNLAAVFSQQVPTSSLIQNNSEKSAHLKLAVDQTICSRMETRSEYPFSVHRLRTDRNPYWMFLVAYWEIMPCCPTW